MSQASPNSVATLKVYSWPGFRRECPSRATVEFCATPCLNTLARLVGAPHCHFTLLTDAPQRTQLALAYPGACFWRPSDVTQWNGVWHVVPPTPRRARELAPVSEVSFLVGATP